MLIDTQSEDLALVKWHFSTIHIIGLYSTCTDSVHASSRSTVTYFDQSKKKQHTYCNSSSVCHPSFIRLNAEVK